MVFHAPLFFYSSRRLTAPRGATIIMIIIIIIIVVLDDGASVIPTHGTRASTVAILSLGLSVRPVFFVLNGAPAPASTTALSFGAFTVIRPWVPRRRAEPLLWASVVVALPYFGQRRALLLLPCGAP